MNIQIKNRWTGAVLYECEAKSMIEAVVKAVEAKADLRGSNLRGSNLRGSNLSGSDLSGSDLRGSNLRDSDLSGSNLRGSNLRDSDLSGSYLSGSDLRGSDLRGSNLRDSDLSDSNLRGSELPHFQICPEIGSFTAFKKLKHADGTTEIATLLIPDGARRTSSLVGRKCRAERVRVLSGNGHSPTAGQNGVDGEILEYREGDLVEADSFDDDIRVECSHGIHFYMTRKEAEEH